MPHGHKHRFWRLCRIYFRRVRITVWLVLLAAVGAWVYLNQVGLPGFVKRPLLDKLRSRGLDMEFTRLRLSWYRGIVAENVRFGQADEPLTPRLTAREVGVQLNARALRRLTLQIDSLLLLQGRFSWPVAETNEAPRELTMENIQTYLRLLPEDEWALDNFTANFEGTKIHLLGKVAHASALRDWKMLKAEKPTPGRVWRARWRQLADTLEQTHFAAPPELRLDVRGDARDLESFTVRLMLTAEGADSPWGRFESGRLTARLYPALSNELSRATLSLEAKQAHTRWATTRQFDLKLNVWRIEGQTNFVDAEVHLAAAQAETRWASATNLTLTARLRPVQDQTDIIGGDLALQAAAASTQWGAVTNARVAADWIYSLTNPVPISGNAEIHCEQAQNDLGIARGIQLAGRLETPGPNPEVPSDPSWALWAAAEPYALGVQCKIDRLDSPKLQANAVTFGGSWRAPDLTLTNVHAELYRGQLDAAGAANVATRKVRLTLASTFDPHPVGPLLGPMADRWLAQFTWTNPPQAQGEISVVLPSWTNQQPDWATEVLPSLRIVGQFNVPGGGTYRGLRASSARSHFSYLERTWRLPDLFVQRPEGSLQALHMDNERTREFYWKFNSTVSPDAARPALSDGAREVLDLFTFTDPPSLQAEIWGHKDKGIGFQGAIALTNFTFRGKSFTGVQTELRYTNRVADFLLPRVQRGTERISADRVIADFNTDKVYVTNGFSTADPQAVAEAIGPKIGAAIEPYRWSQRPTVYVQGTIPMHREEEADLKFQVDGGPFHWARLNVPQISGNLHWQGLKLILSDVRAVFYDGRANGSANILFNRNKGPDYQFYLTTTNSLLHALMADVKTGTNRLEGALSGTLIVNRGNADEWPRMDGHGNLTLRDGLIWEIPLFGIFSPVLNGIAPGLGNSRARQGTCRFTVTNGVFYSDDLEIRSTGMRLQYRGTLDVEGKVRARVEAGLLRDMWVVGPIVSTVLWPFSKLFEYRVSGSLDQLKMEPVYLLPKLMLLPFSTLRLLTEPAPEPAANSRTNAPPNPRP